MREDDKPYQLALVSGANLDQVAAVADTIVDLTPAAGTDVPAAVTEKLRGSGLTPADVRAKAVLIVDGDGDAAVAVYAAVTGFASRHVDVATTGGVIHTGAIWDAGAGAEDAGKPGERTDVIQVGGQHGSIPVFDLDLANPVDGLVPRAVSQLRWARRVRIALPDSLAGRDRLVAAIVAVSAISGLRSRKGQERMPMLVVEGADPAAIPATGPLDEAGEPTELASTELIDLDGVRSAAATVRRGIRGYSIDQLAPRVEPSPRQARLAAAAITPIDAVLDALGSQRDGELWQCPRPTSHTHGDLTPSMKVTDGKARCYVDDNEWIDTLRLVMSACSATPDEAAELLEGGPEALAPYREVILAERAARNT